MKCNMKLKPAIPRSLPLKNLNWAALVPSLGAARDALARYDETVRRTPKQLLKIFQWAESAHSLRGQQIEASLKEILCFAFDPTAAETRAPLLQKIIHYQEALSLASKRQPLDIPFLCRLHALIKKDGPNPKEIGRIRMSQNWIGPEGQTIEKATFLPPSPARIPAALDSLSRYFRSNDLDPLVQIALYFAQLLIIHPFMDGNGRVARTLIPLLLWKKGLLSQPALYLSRYFEEHRASYFQKLFQITENNAWEEWVIYFLNGIAIQSGRHKTQAEKILALSSELPAAALPLFEHPVQRTKNRSLLKKKILTESPKGLYLFEPLFKIVQ